MHFRKGIAMDEESLTMLLQENIIALIKTVTDIGLLDLIFKLLL